MKKVFVFLLIFTILLSSISVGAVEITWSKTVLSQGSVTATVKGATEGDRIFVQTLSDGVFSGLDMVWAEGEEDEITVDIDSSDDSARVFVWESDTMKPRFTSEITVNGINDDTYIFSDNQLVNNSNSVGYKAIDPLTGMYSISFELTVLSKGDNAIMIGDSSNGTLGYSTSSAILLFNGDNFTVRKGNGSGSYSEAAVTLCSVKLNTTYKVSFIGNTEKNTFYVVISDGDNQYVSDIISARKNATENGIDTLAFVSNSKNTTVVDGYCSNYAFYGRNLDVKSENIDSVALYSYDGFEGMYYGLKVGDSYVRGNSGKLTADYDSPKDESAMFIPRDMADGSHAIVCKSSNNRITTPSTILQNLANSAYVPTDNSQHWILEKTENYSEDNQAYYMKHLDNGYYIGKSSLTDNLILTTESNKVEIVFVPLKNESPLYLISRLNVYNFLTTAQRERIETVYESVAGDIFGRYGGYSDWTPRIRMDNLFAEILDGTLTETEQLTMLEEFLNSTNGFIYSNQASWQTISTSIPGTSGVYCETDEGTAGTYDFWRGTELAGVLYKLYIYDVNGTLEQTINLYVQDDGTAQTNANTFKNIITQIPYTYRQHLTTVKPRSDSANSYNGGGGVLYIRLNWTPNADSMRSTVVHELGHINDQACGTWSSGSGWTSAISSDMYTPSTYGASNSTEDFAEFCRMYFAAYGNPDMQRGLQVIMPQRYASFGRLRKNNLSGWGLWEDDYTTFGYE